MTPDERTGMYMNYLTKEGYRPTAKDSTLVAFKHDGGNYFLLVDKDDEEYFRLVYPNFWSIDSDMERVKAFRCANEVTAQFKVAKVYVNSDGTDVWADVETFLRHPSDYEAIFPRVIRELPQVVRRFVEKMNQD